jgi:sigma-B regulation protein RsbU (phosphoserine phosphatase)
MREPVPGISGARFAWRARGTLIETLGRDMVVDAAHRVPAEAPARVLIADDHPDVITAVQLLLKAEGYQLHGVQSPEALLEALRCQAFDLVLVDLNYTRDTTSGAEGLALLPRIRALDRDIAIVAMTAWGNVALAVHAMRVGVDDFLQKPWDNAQLVLSVRHHVQTSRTRRLEQQRHATHEQARTDERDAVREIQRTLLPARLPSPPGTDVAVFWEPVGAVGGDFYDGAALDDRRAWFCIGDVAGKGTSAALLMASVQALVRLSVTHDVTPSAVCDSVNRELCRRIVGNRFVTFFFCVYDATDRALVYANAGHNPPLLVSASGRVRSLATGGAVLGIFGDAAYRQEQVSLAPGDRLVMFTDGITEAPGRADTELTESRLADLVVASRHLDATRLNGAIVAAARGSGDAVFDDDATVLTMAV